MADRRANTDTTSCADSHVNYWNQQGKANNMEHDRFEAGLNQGWEDALMFINTQGPPGSGQRSTSRMGFVHEFCKRRTQQHAITRGGGKWLWEYGEHLKASLRSDGAEFMHYSPRLQSMALSKVYSWPMRLG